ncbi:MAG: uracil-DNA glycosylase family protein [Sphingomonas sp.]|uniref:uracil-DNA glycosylase family protein n=1 Tax=Sphingomonas sp. TaxID=28214 RepID=UPI003F82186C
MSFIFVGEKPSRTAYERGISWHNGGLAAKTLWDALVYAGIDRTKCGFMNLFGETPDSPEKVTDQTVGEALRAASDAGLRVVGMGRKVQRALNKLSVPHIPLTHPAARGAIRAKSAYQEHVKETLCAQVE